MSADLLSKLRLRRTPVVLQSEATECGLACVAMIAGHYGRNIDLRSVRSYYQASLQGSSIRDLIEIASRLDLASRPVRSELQSLEQLRLPCIIHWNFNHFVVLERIGTNRIQIIDPARGVQSLTYEKFSRSFTGIALEAWPDTGFERRQEKSTITIASMFSAVRGLPKIIFYIFLCSLAVEAITLTIPLATQFFIDVALQSYDLPLVNVVSTSILVLLIIRLAITYARSWLSMLAKTQINISWSSSLFSRMISLPASFFERRHVGDITSRFSSLTNIQDAFTSDLIAALLDSSLLLIVFVALFFYSPLIGMVVAAFCISYLLLRVSNFRISREAAIEAIVQEAKQNSHFLETIRGITNVKLFGIGGSRRSAWLNLVVDEINAKIREFRIDLINQALGSFITGCAMVAVLWIGSHQVSSGTLSFGMLFAVLLYVDMALTRSVRIVDAVSTLFLLSLHTDRIAEIALEEPEAHQFAASSYSLSKTSPSSLTIRNVRYQYSEGVQPILKDVSFYVNAGECLAITGPSGCGKTTLLKILVGLIAPDHGSVEFDGVDIRTLGLSEYRSRISCVMQDGHLFAGSIHENISLFEPNSDPAWVKRCAEMAAIAEDVEALPMKYDTMVGDMGSVLSGGQRQRVAIARALYRRPKLLFMDEATSDLDSDNEHKINAAIRSMSVTRIIIAHRESTIQMADRVVCLADINADSGS